MSNDVKRVLLYVAWVGANLIGVGCIVYGNNWILRLIGWLWGSFAISLSGVFVIGLISHEKFKD